MTFYLPGRLSSNAQMNSTHQSSPLCCDNKQRSHTPAISPIPPGHLTRRFNSGCVSSPLSYAHGTISPSSCHGGDGGKTTSSSVLGSSLRNSRMHGLLIRRALHRRNNATVEHPMRRLRELGSVVLTASTATSKTSTVTLPPLTTIVEELFIPLSYTVRLHDVEGRMLNVSGEVIETSPIASCISQCSIYDGTAFFIKPLYNIPTTNTLDGSYHHTIECHHVDFKEANTGGGGGVPPWKRYAAAITLYIALADAGYCDASLPFLSVQWMDWRKLVRDQLYLRLGLMSNSAMRGMLPPRIQHHMKGKTDTRGGGGGGVVGEEERDEEERKFIVPVALILPVTMKGTLRRPITTNVVPSISTHPFTDVEVFQLFYLQLVFRALYDVRFPGMMFGEHNNFFRSDLIAVDTSGGQPLAFQTPTCPNRWLLFPPRSKILHFMGLEEAVIPHYASWQECNDTAQHPLVGATPLLPCQGQLGRRVVMEWAVHVVIRTPQEASSALAELFTLYDSLYGVDRSVVWNAPVAPRIYRCGNLALNRLREGNDDLAFFFTSVALPKDSIPLESGEVTTNNYHMAEITKKEDRHDDPHLHDANANDKGGKDAILQRWQQYIQDGCLRHFDRSTDVIKIVRFLGSGGSSLVYEGRYGPHQLPVAVKCFIIPDSMDHEEYVKESLTNVAFLVFFNLLEESGIVQGTCVYDFIVSDVPPKGISQEDVRTCTRQGSKGSNDNITGANGEGHNCIKLCYLVTTLMDGVIGRFLKEDDDGFDPCYDTLINSPLRDGEVFQFLYTQLVLRAVFDYTVLDIMLNGQLRGDNIGYISLIHSNTSSSSSCVVLPTYKGMVFVYQADNSTPPRYLRFPADISDPTRIGPLRFISFADLGQGKQPQLDELIQRGLIGETIVESCIQDDGLGRYWPPDRIYSKYIETHGAVAHAAIEWGAALCVDSPQRAETALRELFELYAPTYGAETLTEEEMRGCAVFTWTPWRVGKLRSECIYYTSGATRGRGNGNSCKGKNG